MAFVKGCTMVESEVEKCYPEIEDKESIIADLHQKAIDEYHKGFADGVLESSRKPKFESDYANAVRAYSDLYYLIDMSDKERESLIKKIEKLKKKSK